MIKIGLTGLCVCINAYFVVVCVRDGVLMNMVPIKEFNVRTFACKQKYDWSERVLHSIPFNGFDLYFHFKWQYFRIQIATSEF